MSRLAGAAGRKTDFYGVAFTAGATSGLSVASGSLTELTAGLNNRVEIAVQNVDTTDAIYIGFDANMVVSAANVGNLFRIAAGETFSFAVTEDVPLYGVTLVTGTTDTRIMELR